MYSKGPGLFQGVTFKLKACSFSSSECSFCWSHPRPLETTGAAAMGVYSTAFTSRQCIGKQTSEVGTVWVLIGKWNQSLPLSLGQEFHCLVSYDLWLTMEATNTHDSWMGDKWWHGFPQTQRGIPQGIWATAVWIPFLVNYQGELTVVWRAQETSFFSTRLKKMAPSLNYWMLFYKRTHTVLFAGEMLRCSSDRQPIWIKALWKKKKQQHFPRRVSLNLSKVCFLAYENHGQSCQKPMDVDCNRVWESESVWYRIKPSSPSICFVWWS